MKPKSLLAVICFVVAAAAHKDDQIAFQNPLQAYPGFDLDLSALRWVQLEGQDPVMMTELEKVSSLTPFRPFFSSSESHLLLRSISRQRESSSSTCECTVYVAVK